MSSGRKKRRRNEDTSTLTSDSSNQQDYFRSNPSLSGRPSRHLVAGTLKLRHTFASLGPLRKSKTASRAQIHPSRSIDAVKKQPQDTTGHIKKSFPQTVVSSSPAKNLQAEQPKPRQNTKVTFHPQPQGPSEVEKTNALPVHGNNQASTDIPTRPGIGKGRGRPNSRKRTLSSTLERVHSQHGSAPKARQPRSLSNASPYAKSRSQSNASAKGRFSNVSPGASPQKGPRSTNTYPRPRHGTAVSAFDEGKNPGATTMLPTKTPRNTAATVADTPATMLPTKNPRNTAATVAEAGVVTMLPTKTPRNTAATVAQTEAKMLPTKTPRNTVATMAENEVSPPRRTVFSALQQKLKNPVRRNTNNPQPNSRSPAMSISLPTTPESGSRTHNATSPKFSQTKDQSVPRWKPARTRHPQKVQQSPHHLQVPKKPKTPADPRNIEPRELKDHNIITAETAGSDGDDEDYDDDDDDDDDDDEDDDENDPTVRTFHDAEGLIISIPEDFVPIKPFPVSFFPPPKPAGLMYRLKAAFCC